jgi:hypothetical protein
VILERGKLIAEYQFMTTCARGGNPILRLYTRAGLVEKCGMILKIAKDNSTA